MKNFNLKYLGLGVISISALMIVSTLIFSSFNKSKPTPNQSVTINKSPLENTQVISPKANGNGSGGAGKSATSSSEVKKIYTGLLKAVDRDKITLTIANNTLQFKLLRPVSILSCDDLNGKNCVNQLVSLDSLKNQQIKIQILVGTNELRTVWFKK